VAAALASREAGLPDDAASTDAASTAGSDAASTPSTPQPGTPVGTPPLKKGLSPAKASRPGWAANALPRKGRR